MARTANTHEMQKHHHKDLMQMIQRPTIHVSNQTKHELAWMDVQQCGQHGNCGTRLCYLNRRTEQTNLHHAHNTKNAHGDRTYTNMSLHNQRWYFALTLVVTGGDGAKPPTEGSGVTTEEGPSASGDSPGTSGCESVDEDSVSPTPVAGSPSTKGDVTTEPLVY